MEGKYWQVKSSSFSQNWALMKITATLVILGFLIGLQVAPKALAGDAKAVDDPENSPYVVQVSHPALYHHITRLNELNGIILVDLSSCLP